MTATYLLNDPPVHDRLVSDAGKATPQLSEWLRHAQDSINLFMGSFKSGTYHTVAGATQAIPAPGVKAGDLAFVVVGTSGATPRTIVSQATIDNQINVVMSGDPGTDHILNWLTFKSS